MPLSIQSQPIVEHNPNLDSIWQQSQLQNVPSHSLFVIATPIGNLADLSLRALNILSRVDAIACEDTRHSKSLLQHYGIHKPLMASHDHNEHEAASLIVKRLQAGDRIALISDAGTPAISDPGARVVQQVLAAGLRVVPVPGASAVVTALSATGIDGPFSFIGFLPNKSAARVQLLKSWLTTPSHLVFYEAPHRLNETIKDLSALFPNRTITVARELTKLYESIVAFPLADAHQWLKDHTPRGEYVLIVHASTQDTQVIPNWAATLQVLLKQLPLKQAVSLTVDITGAAKNEVYESALMLKNTASTDS